MTENERITVNLQLTVSELTLVMAVPFLLIGLAVFVVVARKLKRPVKAQVKLG